jgi:hypothetical protein
MNKTVKLTLKSKNTFNKQITLEVLEPEKKIQKK